MNTYPGNRPLSLAAHFRNVAALIENNLVSYAWDKCEKCNCGLVARSIIGESLSEFGRSIEALNPTPDFCTNWTRMAEHYCPISGEPMNWVFKKLYLAGMRYEDFGHLEHLSNRAILDRMHTMFQVHRTEKRFLRKPIVTIEILPEEMENRNTLIAYLKTWATLIEEHNATAQTNENLDAVELRPLVESK